MFRPLPLYIGLRYLQTKKNNRFISFTNGISILGIALSVAILVTVLSIMNGFDQTVREKIFGMAHHLTVQDIRPSATEADWLPLREALLKEPHVVGVAPFLLSHSLLNHTNLSQPALLYGILPSLESSVSSIADQTIEGNFRLSSKKNGIVLSERLATELNASIGTKLTVYIPLFNASLLSKIPYAHTVEIIGIFKPIAGIGLDNSLAYMHLGDLQAFAQKKEAITGLRLKIDELYKAPYLCNRLSGYLPKHYIATDWTTRYGGITRAIALEKTVTLWILLLLIAIIAFNLMSSLIMLITEKQSEIAILRTLGMSSSNILGVFVVQGSLIGLIGTLLGLIFGVLLSSNISYLSTLVEHLFRTQLFPGNLFIQTLPSQMQWPDFIQVGFASLMISTLVTIYPAWRAAKVIPIEALRHE